MVLFMVFHGHAHGAEMPHGTALATYMAGFIVATLLITFMGRGLGALMMKADSRLVRGLGGVVAVLGGVLAAS